MNDIYEEKKIFVAEKLLPLIQAIDYTIISAEYHTLSRHPYDLEYILITWTSGTSQRVYVTGDSLSALSRDVLGAIK